MECWYALCHLLQKSLYFLQNLSCSLSHNLHRCDSNVYALEYIISLSHFQLSGSMVTDMEVVESAAWGWWQSWHCVLNCPESVFCALGNILCDVSVFTLSAVLIISFFNLWELLCAISKTCHCCSRYAMHSVHLSCTSVYIIYYCKVGDFNVLDCLSKIFMVKKILSRQSMTSFLIIRYYFIFAWARYFLRNENYPIYGSECIQWSQTNGTANKAQEMPVSL